jgi:hypothetical protein
LFEDFESLFFPCGVDVFSSFFNVALISHQQTFSQKAFMFSANKLSK